MVLSWSIGRFENLMVKENFSHKVRCEAAGAVSSRRHCQLAELAGLLLTSESIGRNGISFSNENQMVAKKVFTLIRKAYKINPDVSVSTRGNGRKMVYTVSVYAEAAVKEILSGIKLGGSSEIVDELLIQKSCCKRAFVRGCFLASGSVTDPAKGYHLEIVYDSESMAAQLCRIISEFIDDEFGEVKYTKRKKPDGRYSYVVYIKEGDRISDFLNMCECYRSLMDMENIRVTKEIANTLNRRQNCEMANMVKTISAAQEQKNDIIYINEMIGIEKLPSELQQIAKIRMNDTETTLKELGELLTPSVSKSCVNHRLRKLKKIAEDLRAGKEIKL